MEIKVDIAGMYYGRMVVLDDRSSDDDPYTVRDALVAARRADQEDRRNGGKKPQLNFAEDDRLTPFLRSISVDHIENAVSRQDKSRTYPAGEYAFRSDGVAKGPRTDGTMGFVAVDQDGNPSGKRFIQTWQYYVYSAAGVDISRAASSPDFRKVVPFSVSDESNRLENGSQIVFRLVTIFIDPTRRPAIKTAVEKGRTTNLVTALA
jgi:hypothetical protein